MERRYRARLQGMLAQAEVSSDLIDGLMGRLETFVEPFTVALAEPEQRQHTVEYISGLLSKLDHKTGEAIAYLHDQERQGIQKFIGHVPWDHQPLLMTLARQVGDGPGRTGRRDRVRPLGLSQEGDQVGGRGTTVVRSARKGRELPGRRLHGLRFEERTRDRRYEALPPQGMDEGPAHGGTRPGCPRRSSSRRVTSWPCRCWTNRARCCRTRGWRVTMKWAVRRAFAWPCAAASNGICWPSPRTRWSAIWTCRRRHTRGTADARRVRSRAWIAGARRCPKRVGR